MEWTTIVDVAHDADISVGTESSQAIKLVIQLKDYAGNDMKVRSTIWAYMSKDAAGDVIIETAFDGIAAGTDGLCQEITTGQLVLLTSESDGDIDLTVSETEAFLGYLVLVMPDGKLKISGAIQFE